MNRTHTHCEEHRLQRLSATGSCQDQGHLWMEVRGAEREGWDGRRNGTNGSLKALDDPHTYTLRGAQAAAALSNWLLPRPGSPVDGSEGGRKRGVGWKEEWNEWIM